MKSKSQLTSVYITGHLLTLLKSTVANYILIECSQWAQHKALISSKFLVSSDCLQIWRHRVFFWHNSVENAIHVSPHIQVQYSWPIVDCFKWTTRGDLEPQHIQWEQTHQWQTPQRSYECRKTRTGNSVFSVVSVQKQYLLAAYSLPKWINYSLRQEKTKLSQCSKECNQSKIIHQSH